MKPVLRLSLTCDVYVDPVTEYGAMCIASDALVLARIAQLNLGYLQRVGARVGR